MKKIGEWIDIGKRSLGNVDEEKEDKRNIGEEEIENKRKKKGRELKKRRKGKKEGLIDVLGIFKKD